MSYETEFVNEVLKNTQYENKAKPQERRLSGSSYDLEPMQHYLKWKYGDLDKENEITASTIGSVFHHGMEKIFSNNPQYETEKSLEKVLPNGWLITGSIDLIDLKNKVVIDHKLVAGGTAKKIKNKEVYISQLSIYRWLVGSDYTAAIALANKAGSAVRNDQYEIVDITDDLWSYDETEEILIDKINEIEAMIEDPSLATCDMYRYGRSKDKTPNACKFYCQFGGSNPVCPIFQNQLGISNHFATNNLLM